MPAYPDERLVEHLIARYWQGKLNPQDSEDLLAQVYDGAPDELRAHAIEFLTTSHFINLRHLFC